MNNHFEVRRSPCCCPVLCTDCLGLCRVSAWVSGLPELCHCRPLPSSFDNFSLVESKEGPLGNKASFLGGVPLFGTSPSTHLPSSSR